MSPHRQTLTLLLSTLINTTTASECDFEHIKSRNPMGPKFQPHLDGCKTLHLYGAMLGDEGATVLAEALRGHRDLKNLYLSSNNIGDVGARAIADALRSNRVITTLYLSGNLITNEGARALGDALSKGALIELYLGQNQIGDAGAFAMAAALRGPGRLQKAFLTGNPFGRDANRALQSAADWAASKTRDEL